MVLRGLTTPMDLQKMIEASTHLIGSHDFRNFAKMDVGNGVVQFIRKIFDFTITPWDPSDMRSGKTSLLPTIASIITNNLQNIPFTLPPSKVMLSYGIRFVILWVFCSLLGPIEKNRH